MKTGRKEEKDIPTLLWNSVGGYCYGDNDCSSSSNCGAAGGTCDTLSYQCMCNLCIPTCTICGGSDGCGGVCLNSGPCSSGTCQNGACTGATTQPPTTGSGTGRITVSMFGKKARRCLAARSSG